MLGVEDEIERSTALILASEDWSHRYDKTPLIHTKLIKTEAKLERKLRGFFRDLSKDAYKFVNWSQYHVALNAFNVDVVVSDDQIDNMSGLFINLVLEEITTATALGAQSGEELYSIARGLSSSSASIQDIALNHAAQLVGKTVKDGKIINNPKAGMSITETTRADIRQSISTSLSLGEDMQAATDRLRSVINNPKRAELIARTETVNSFGQGLSEFGRQTEAVGKEWDDVGASDECADNTAAGPIPFDDTFPSGDMEPAAHPNCRCSMRLIYQNEIDDNPDLFNSN